MNLHSEWLKTPVGRNLLAQERAVIGATLQQVFGDYIIQLGSWGEPDFFLDKARTRYKAVVNIDPVPGIAACLSHENLAIATDSVDAVFLPHTLELSLEPHAVLREVYRILRPEGRLVALGFTPTSLWGLRHQFAEQGFPPGLVRHISRRRMSDWLQLLSLSIDQFAPITLGTSGRKRNSFWRKFFWSQPAYMVLATKEIVPMTHGATESQGAAATGEWVGKPNDPKRSMNDVVMYTDGACRGNPGPGGWGVSLRSGEAEKNLYGGEADTTNNRMELTAAIRGLEALKRASRVKIFTDSNYVRQGITEWIGQWKRRGWKTAGRKPVKNVDLWQELDRLAGEHDIEWHWVKGHSGDPGNELADQLANLGIDEMLAGKAAGEPGLD